MKYIFLNLKRFDILPEKGGVNRLAPPAEWGGAIVKQTEPGLTQLAGKATFAQFYPEAHIPAAVAAKAEGSPLQIGCQSVYRGDTAPGGNFGAFTTGRTANSMAALGCGWAIIGHCEERNDKAGILAEAGVTDAAAINRLLNAQVLAAQAAGLKVLYCIGEKEEEQQSWQDVLGAQLATGLAGADMANVVIAYEPVWSIGPGKTPAGREYIQMVASFVKDKTNGAPVVYGGGLKTDNAEMLASIPEIDGGLIALTRFTGEIGFYPDEYLDIIRLYLG